MQTEDGVQPCAWRPDLSFYPLFQVWFFFQYSKFVGAGLGFTDSLLLGNPLLLEKPLLEKIYSQKIS